MLASQQGPFVLLHPRARSERPKGIVMDTEAKHQAHVYSRSNTRRLDQMFH